MITYPPEWIVPEPLPTYKADHHVGKGFQNDPGAPYHSPTHSIFTLEWLKFITKKRDTPAPLAITDPLPSFKENGKIRVYWLGHATCLLRFKDVAIITDPVFSDHAAPLPIICKRVTPPPCAVESLPRIDLVLISHDHYDHLDPSSLLRIKRHSPDVIFFAPLVVARLINSWGFPCVEFDWRQHANFRGLDIICFPARHATCRYGLDFKQRLWCSWIIRDIQDDVTVFFPGDTAIGPHFAELRETLGKQLDLALMPIGPQEPACWMRVVHLDPVDAYEMAKVLNVKDVIPIHYGTFPLGQEPKVPDLELLNSVWKDDNLHVINVGDFLEWNGTKFDKPE